MKSRTPLKLKYKNLRGLIQNFSFFEFSIYFRYYCYHLLILSRTLTSLVLGVAKLVGRVDAKVRDIIN